MADKKINKIKPNLGNAKPMNNVPKINPYWIYGVIIIAFLAIQWFTLGAGPVETNWMEVKNTMLKNNDIKKIIVLNREEAQNYLKETRYDKY
ncbi:MAG: peptidase M41, partial [Bacteroidota bacterium]|nr:peptidase M41 [Bacteroidota bacterium]